MKRTIADIEVKITNKEKRIDKLKHRFKEWTYGVLFIFSIYWVIAMHVNIIPSTRKYLDVFSAYAIGLSLVALVIIATRYVPYIYYQKFILKRLYNTQETLTIK